MSRRARIVAAAVPALAAAALVPAPSPAAAATWRGAVTAQPSLQPAFHKGTPDYVVRCDPDRRVRLSIAAPPGTRVAVGNRRAKRGAFRASVRLVPGRAVALRFESGSRTRTYGVRCLPPDFPVFESRRYGRRPQARFYLVTPSVDRPDPGYVALFDTHGAPVWWMRGTPSPFDAHLLPNGDLAWTKWVGHQPASGYFEEHALDGSLRRRLSTVGEFTNQHDLQVLPGGHALLITYPPRGGVDLSPWGGPADATVLDGEIQEIDAQGKLVWSWSTAGHVATAETRRWFHRLIVETRPIQLPDGRLSYDIAHMNSIDLLGNRLVFSLRHTDAVYEIDRTTGDVVWKLGGTRTPRSLRIVGDPLGSDEFGGQHDARLSRDGRTLTLFENGTRRARPPRVLRFRIDVAKRTAKLLRTIRWRPARKSTCCGSARRLPGGNWVVSWGNTKWVTEQTGAGAPVFGLRFRHGLSSYRAQPVLPGRLTRAALRRGMDAMISP